MHIRFWPTHLPPHSTSVRIVFFKEDMTEIYFANYYQSKNHKHCSKIKKLLDKAFEKYRVKISDRALGSSLDFEYRRDGKRSFLLWSEYLPLFYFYFVTNLSKKLMAYVRWQLTSLPTNIIQYAFSWTTLAPAERIYYTDDPKILKK